MKRVLEVFSEFLELYVLFKVSIKGNIIVVEVFRGCDFWSKSFNCNGGF